MKLSDTARVLLIRASQHPEHLAEPPKHLPAAARDAVVRSLLKNGLLAETPCPRQHLSLAWRQDYDGVPIALRVTDASLVAIGIEPERRNAVDEMELGGLTEEDYEAEQDAAHAAMEAGEDLTLEADSRTGTDGATEAPTDGPAAPTPVQGTSALRGAVAAVLTAWDAEGRAGLDNAMQALRVAVTKPTRVARKPGAPRKPREGTKQQQILALLRRPEGASGPAMAEATGWAPHTVRGFLAGLAAKGIRVEVLDRVRQVGPGKDGAKGSYTIYRIAEAG
jgi:hypothetical protein